MTTVIRVQDRFGRGPYRPGMSVRWSDPTSSFDCPPWWVEIGESAEVAHERMQGAYHFGCAFRTRAQLDNWFNEREQRALDRLGYKLAAASADIIVAETSKQVVFGSLTPLWKPIKSCRLVTVASLALVA